MKRLPHAGIAEQLSGVLDFIGEYSAPFLECRISVYNLMNECIIIYMIERTLGKNSLINLRKGFESMEVRLS